MDTSAAKICNSRSEGCNCFRVSLDVGVGFEIVVGVYNSAGRESRIDVVAKEILRVVVVL